VLLSKKRGVEIEIALTGPPRHPHIVFWICFWFGCAPSTASAEFTLRDPGQRERRPKKQKLTAEPVISIGILLVLVLHELNR
jgi:hypothetical protein